MKKYLIIIILLFFGGIFIKIFFLKDHNNNKVYIEKYVSNLNWENNYKKKTYYKSGDNISFTIFIKNIKNKKIILNKKCFSNLLKVKELNITLITGENIYFINLKGITNKSGMYNIKNIDFKKCYKLENKIENKRKNIIESNNNKEKKIKLQNSENNEIIEKIKLKNTHFISNQDNLVELSGINLENIDSIGIGVNKFWKVFYYKEKYYVKITKNKLNGKYLVYFVSKQGKIDTNGQYVYFKKYKNGTFISYFIPNEVIAGGSFTFVGKGFKKIISIQFSNSIISKKTDFKIISDSMLVIKIPFDFPEGKYSINILTTEGIYSFPDIKFTIKHFKK